MPSDFDRTNPQGGATRDAAGDAGSAPTSAGYGYGYGYGLGNAVAGESELSLVHYLQILYRRRYIAGAAFLIVVAGVALYTVTAARIYQGTVQILIERDTPNVVSFQEVLDQGEITDDYYETQYRILQSRALARRTLDALNLWGHEQFNAPPRLSARGIVMCPINVAARWFEPERPAEPPGANGGDDMVNLAKGLAALAAVAFVMAVATNFAGAILATAEGWSRAATNLALLALAVVACFDDRLGVRTGRP